VLGNPLAHNLAARKTAARKAGRAPAHERTGNLRPAAQRQPAGRENPLPREDQAAGAACSQRLRPGLTNRAAKCTPSGKEKWTAGLGCEQENGALSAAGESTRKNEKTSAHTALGGKNARSDRRPKTRRGRTDRWPRTLPEISRREKLRPASRN
jgi:hypothetical protein